MAKITFPNMEAYERQLERIGSEAPKLCGKALYQGARVLAEAVQAEIDGLSELSPSQRRGLHNGLGVAHFWEKGGVLQTKIGFEGYNTRKSKRWPKGQPNAMIARAVIRGTSWMMPNRFTPRAARKAKAAAIEAIRQELDKGLEAETK